MQRYKAFLKYLLTANIVFILIVAGMGYRQEYEKKKLAEVTASLSSQDKVQKDRVIPVGQTVGIYVNTDGILVIDTGEVTDLTGKKLFACQK